MIPASYSFLDDLANCPHKAMRKFVKRDLPRKTSPELEEGTRIHSLLESYINDRGKIASVPQWLKPYADVVLRADDVRAEAKLGMTKDILSADFFPGDGLTRQTAFGRDPWLRGKLDVLVIQYPAACIIDWKTGKVREDPRELFVQAMLVRANYPEIHRITGFYVWLAEGKLGKIYDLTDVNQTYQNTVAAIEDAERYEREAEWPKKPNPLCGWCPVKDCQFNKNPKL